MCKYYINCYTFGGFCYLVGSDMYCGGKNNCVWYKEK